MKADSGGFAKADERRVRDQMIRAKPFSNYQLYDNCTKALSGVACRLVLML